MLKFKKTPILFSRAIPALLPLLANSAQASPPELLSLQESYKKKVAEVIAPSAKAFATDLLKIANSQAAKGNYLEAATTKSKATSTLAHLQSLKISASSTLILPLTEASNIGSVSYDETSGTLGRFTDENAQAHWELRQITPGTYSVSLTYSVNHQDHEERLKKQGLRDEQEAGGTFQILEDTKLQRLDNSTNSITHEAISTGSWEAYRTEIIGNITLASTSATIVLEALAPKPQGLMQLREIRLTPQSKQTTLTTTPSKSPQALATLKREYEARIAPIIAPLLTEYTAELTSIKNAANAAGDEKTAQRATQALRKFRESTKTEAPTSSLPSITLSGVNDLKVQLSGTTTSNASRSYLTHLGPGGEAAITWQLPSTRPHTQFYQASIRQRPTSSSGGRLTLTAGKNEISHYLARPKEKQLKSASFEDTPLGTLEIPTSASAIQLRIESLDPDSDTLADLESLILQPLADALAAKNTIAKQDEAHQKRIKNTARGWEAIKGATYIPSDSASASKFRIKTASGETLDIALYGITSPRPSYSESERDLEKIRLARVRRALDQRDLERIGKKALKLVTDALATGKCTIWTHRETTNENTFATITTAEGTPLSLILTSEGLASESHQYGYRTFPIEIHPDLSPSTYKRWINVAIERAKRGKKGIWKKRQ